jgi:hypothetical protein
MENDVDIRLECLRLAVEFGTQRDVVNPAHLADSYYKWVTQGSESSRPVGSREDDSPKRANKARGVRKGSTPQLV